MAAGFVQDPAGNQLSFATGIGSNDDFRDVFSEKLCLYIMVLFGCLLDYDKFPFLWNHREIGHIPGFEFFVIFFGVGECDQMAKCPGYDIVAAFDRTGNVLMTAKNTGDVAGNGWLFCQYE